MDALRFAGVGVAGRRNGQDPVGDVVRHIRLGLAPECGGRMPSTEPAEHTVVRSPFPLTTAEDEGHGRLVVKEVGEGYR